MEQLQNSNDFVLRYHGFHPSEFTKSYLTSKMALVWEKAPYGATLNATFTRQGENFKATVIIFSASGRFFASASGRRLKEVSKRLVDQINKQLSKWRTQRFKRSPEIYEQDSSAS